MTQDTFQTALGLELGALRAQHAVPEVELSRPCRGNKTTVALGVGVAHQTRLLTLPQRPTNPVDLPTKRNVVLNLRGPKREVRKRGHRGQEVSSVHVLAHFDRVPVS